MKLELLRSVIVDGEAAAVGSVVDVPEADARYLLARGLARPVEPIEEAVVDMRSRETAVLRRGKRGGG